MPNLQSTSGTSPHGIFTEFQRNMEHDLQRHNRHVHLSHSCSMPLLRSMHAPGPVSFECDIGSSDLDEIMESTPPAPAQPLPAVQPSGGPAPEGVMEALLSLTSTVTIPCPYLFPSYVRRPNLQLCQRHLRLVIG